MDKNAKKLIMLLGTPMGNKTGKSNNMPMSKGMANQNTSKTVKKKASKVAKKKTTKKATTQNTLPWSSQNKGC